jgi:acetyltransferase EpsM
MVESVWVIGAGGHGKVVAQALIASGRAIAGVVDENDELIGTTMLGHRIQSIDKIPIDALALIAVGDGIQRQMVAEKLNLKWQTVIHPSAVIDPTVDIGIGCVIMAGAVIQADATIGKHSIVNTGASVDHDCTIGDFSHICPGARIAGHVKVGFQALFGTNACVIPNVSVGDNVVIGAGAVLIRDVESRSTMVGVPARRLHADESS